MQFTLDQAVRDYLTECQQKQLSRKTLRMYGDDLRLFREFSRDGDFLIGRFGDRPVGSFVKLDVTAFFGGIDEIRKRLSRDPRKSRIDRPLGAVARHAYARAIRAFWRWAFKNELIDKPIAVEMPKLPVKEIAAIRPDEIEKILAQAKRERDTSLRHQRDYILALLLAYTGARRAEVLALTVGDLDFDSDPANLLIRHGKGDKARRVVLHPDIAGELLRYRRVLMQHEIDWLIFSDRTPTRPLVEDRPNAILRALARRAGVDPRHANCHKWRHSFCSRLANNGVNLAVIQDMAGHADIATTRRYIKTTPEAQRAALAALTFGGRGKGR